MYWLLVDGIVINDELVVFNVLDVVMKFYFILEIIMFDDQMCNFLKCYIYFVLVVDEYGGLQGLIMFEDIFEEIVGEILDEFDEQMLNQMICLFDGNWIVEGGIIICDLNCVLDWNLLDEEVNIVVGFVIYEV